MSDETGEAVRQWRAKARSDWTTVEILLGSERCPADTVCFHCQQLVEKLLKALLTRHGIEAPKTHDLRRLIRLAEPFAGLAAVDVEGGLAFRMAPGAAGSCKQPEEVFPRKLLSAL